MISKASKDVFSTFTTQIVGIGLSFLIGVLTARTLGPEGKGIYTLVFTLPSLLYAFGSLGIGQAIVYIVARNMGRISEIFTSYILIYCIIASLLTGLAFISIPWLSETFFKGVDTQLLKVGLISLPAIFWIHASREFFRGKGNYLLYNAVGFLNKLQLLIFLFIALFLLQLGTSGAIYANTLSNLLLAILCLAGVIGFALNYPIKFSAEFVRPLLSFGGRVHVGSVLHSLENRGDLLLLNYFLANPAMVGLYSVAVTIAEFLLNIPEAVGAVWLQRVSSSTAEIPEKSSNLSRIVVGTSLMAAVGMILLAYPAIYLAYGSLFLPSYIPFLILIPGIILRGPERVLGSHMQGIGKPGLISSTASISLILNIALNIILIPRIGINGAAIASTVSYSIRSCLVMMLFSRVYHKPLKEFFVPKQRDWAFIFKMPLSALKRLKPIGISQ